MAGALPADAQGSARRAGARTISLAGATGVGIGAIVGGGILALAGVAFSATGPSAMFAFAANGAIALLTALSFAELSVAFPRSGGAYTFAKKVLSVQVAFAVGWVLWFAYIVAGALYALGFAEYMHGIVLELWRLSGRDVPAWLTSHRAALPMAVAAVGAYTWALIRRTAGGGQWATMGKVVVFVVLIGGGAVARWCWSRWPTPTAPAAWWRSPTPWPRPAWGGCCC